jgi:multidrug efflux pump subunit AcrB
MEEKINGVENMIYMSSKSASDGSCNITITFEVGTDVDMATVPVQNRVNEALPILPEEVTRQGVKVEKQSTNITLMINALTLSPALCGMLLRPSVERTKGLFGIFNRMLHTGTEGYTRIVKMMLREVVLTLILVGGLFVGAYFGMVSMPAGFVPSEDEGYFVVAAQLPDATSLGRTEESGKCPQAHHGSVRFGARLGPRRRSGREQSGHHPVAHPQPREQPDHRPQPARGSPRHEPRRA